MCRIILIHYILRGSCDNLLSRAVHSSGVRTVYSSPHSPCVPSDGVSRMKIYTVQLFIPFCSFVLAYWYIEPFVVVKNTFIRHLA